MEFDPRLRKDLALAAGLQRVEILWNARTAAEVLVAIVDMQEHTYAERFLCRSRSDKPADAPRFRLGMELLHQNGETRYIKGNGSKER